MSRVGFSKPKNDESLFSYFILMSCLPFNQEGTIPTVKLLVLVSENVMHIMRFYVAVWSKKA